MSEITGKVIVKNETQTFGSNGFEKRTFVIETEDKYPQTVELELVKDKCDLLDSINLGDSVKATYNLNGRAWEKDGVTRYFNSVQAWKLEKVGATVAPFQTIPDSDLNTIADDEMPF